MSEMARSQALGKCLAPLNITKETYGKNHESEMQWKE